jgi:hypothetical protein
MTKPVSPACGCRHGRALAWLLQILEQHLTTEDVSAIVGRSVSSLKRDRAAGRGIPFIRIGRQVRYRQIDVAGHLDTPPVYRSTSDHPTCQALWTVTQSRKRKA